MEFLRSILFSRVANSDKFELKRDKDNGQWMVIRGTSIMYMGTKEKCQTFLRQH